MNARFKAALVAPFAILIFFLFADFTLKGKSLQPELVKAMEGLWIKQSKDDFSDKILIKDGKFSFLDGAEIRQYDFGQISETGPVGPHDQGRLICSKFKTVDDELIFGWNESSETRYIRSKAGNTLDQWLQDNNLEMDLPSISRYRLLEKKRLIYRIGIGLDETGHTLYTVNGKNTSLSDISVAVKGVLGSLSNVDAKIATGIFLADRAVPMSEVIKTKKELLEANRFREAEGGYPHGDLELSPLLYHCVGLVRLLPPKDAKVLDKDEVEKRGGQVYTIDLSARNTTPRDVDEGLRKFIAGSPDGKYVISLEYDGNIPYGQYVETVDMIFNVVYSFRDLLAGEKYDAPYDKLGKELQLEMRKAYPMALSESMD